MDMTRRQALRNIATGTASVVATTALTTTAHAEESPKAPRKALSLLYDATRCIGCQSCVAACAQVNNMEPDKKLDPLHLAYVDLNSFTKNIIKLYRPSDGSQFSYVKQQCMHCLEPACVAGCSFFALSKDPENGIVSWKPSKCLGCRYCEIACPFHVPKFQWEGFNPKIVKCELCKERLAVGQQPGCTSVCPVQAVVFGTREELLREAKARIAASPGRYYEDRVYGESDGGGTQALYLSHVPFEKLGLPNLGTESIPSKYLKWQKKLYSYLAVPVVLYATMVGVIRGNWKEHQHHMLEDEKKTGLRPQL